MTFSGLDPAEVTRAADALAHQANALDTITGHVDALIRTAMHHWSGPEAQDFHQWWVGQHRPRTVDAARGLHSLSANLRAQVRDQEHASGMAGRSPSAGSAPAPRTPSAMLAFAKNAENPRDPLPPGWNAVDDAGLRKLGIDPRALHNRSSGLDATVYTDGRGNYVLSFAGSAGDLRTPWESSSVDWRENYKSAASGLIANQSAQTQESVNLAMQLKSAVGPGHLELTGHSLGGRDAAIASVATGAPAVTFNAAGVTDEDLLYANEVAGRHTSLGGYLLGKATGGESLRMSTPQSQITNYVVADDVLTIGQLISPARDALGTVHVVPTDTIDPVDAHNLNHFDGKI